MNADIENIVGIANEFQIDADVQFDTPSSELTEKVIGCSFAVANSLGTGFLNEVYENALCHELKKAELEIERNHRANVFYDGVVVGSYVAPIVVEGNLIVEVLTVPFIDDAYRARCANYLRATGFKLALLLNFGSSRVEVKRVPCKLTVSN